MLYKDNWDKSKERFNAFWQGEIIDRCCFAVTAPKQHAVEIKGRNIEPKNNEDKWTNIEQRHINVLNSFNSTYFGADALPHLYVNLGPGVLSGFIGSPPVFGDTTVWFDNDPIIKEWENMPDIRFEEQYGIWKTVHDMTEYFCKKSNGDYLVGMTDLGGTLDILATLRGTENILCDLYDYPDEVKALTGRVDEIWISCYERLAELSKSYMDGYGGWLPLYCSEKSYPIQCDIGVMMSPAQFEEFAIPSLIKQSRAIDKCIYHLDGPGQLNHIDRLLEIETIDAIEWVPLPENGRLTTGNEMWYPLYKKIQDKGKKLIIRDVDPALVERLLENVSPKGLFFTTNVESGEEARELVKKVEKWSV